MAAAGSPTDLFFGRRNPWRLSDDPEATRYTDRSVYWLAVGPGRGLRMRQVWVPPAPGEAPTLDAPAVVHFEENSAFFPRLADGEGRDHWFDGARRLLNTSGGSHPLSARSLTLATPRLSPRAHTVRLELGVAGLTELPADPDHHLIVSVGGQTVGEARWDGPRAHCAAFEFPSTLLAAGDNVVELRLPGDLAGVSVDSVILNYARLAYRARPAAEVDRLAIDVGTARTVEATGFGPGRVVAVDRTDALRPRWLAGIAADAGTVRFRMPGADAASILVAGEGALRSPLAIEPNAPSALHEISADWIAIAPALLADGVAPLADLRASEGLRTAVVDLADVYDEFTAGIPDPVAIRAFLAHVGPRFVLLVGDGHWDPHGYTTAEADRVPVAMVQLEQYWAASDAWYATFRGEDPLPDLSIGRLPVGSAAELAAAVGKIVAWESAGAADWLARASVVADNDDGTFDFSRVVRDQAEILRAGFDVEELLLGSVGRRRVKNDLDVAFADGRYLVAYTGHGDMTSWAAERLLTANEARRSGTPGRQGLVVAMDCMNGMFHVPGAESMGEAMVRADQAGAVAFWGSTTLSNPASQEGTFLEFARLLVSPGDRRLGEALGEATARAWISGLDNGDGLRGWALLGDPATRLRR